MLRSLGSMLVMVVLALALPAAELPYDEGANATSDLQRALAAARAESQRSTASVWRQLVSGLP